MSDPVQSGLTGALSLPARSHAAMVSDNVHGLVIMAMAVLEKVRNNNPVMPDLVPCGPIGALTLRAQFRAVMVTNNDLELVSMELSVKTVSETIVKLLAVMNKTVLLGQNGLSMVNVRLRVGLVVSLVPVNVRMATIVSVQTLKPNHVTCHLAPMKMTKLMTSQRMTVMKRTKTRTPIMIPMNRKSVKSLAATLQMVQFSWKLISTRTMSKTIQTDLYSMVMYIKLHSTLAL